MATSSPPRPAPWPVATRRAARRTGPPPTSTRRRARRHSRTPSPGAPPQGARARLPPPPSPFSRNAKNNATDEAGGIPFRFLSLPSTSRRCRRFMWKRHARHGVKTSCDQRAGRKREMPGDFGARRRLPLPRDEPSFDLTPNMKTPAPLLEGLPALLAVALFHPIANAEPPEPVTGVANASPVRPTLHLKVLDGVEVKFPDHSIFYQRVVPPTEPAARTRHPRPWRSRFR